MRQVAGTQLNTTARNEALSRFAHRYTKDHIPSWAFGKGYPVQFRSDLDWLSNTLFWVRNDGRLAKRNCESKPTWPDGSEMRQ